MYKFSQIQTIHLEITSKCNASCPMCARNIRGGKANPRLPITELRLNDIIRIFPKSLLASIQRIFLCGNYGDPIIAQDTLPILHYFRECNPSLWLELFTNGSARPESWWKELAAVANEVHFGIDGSDEVSEIYRRGTSFATVIRNARSYIEAGGNAGWDFIVFRHNEAQIEAARSLAAELGFKAFRAKKTGRFFSNSRSAVSDSHEVHDRDGKTVFHLEMPLEKKFLNAALAKERLLIEKHGSLAKYFDQTEIDCKVAKEKSLYISAEGLVFPCCWTAGQLYLWYQEPQSSDIAKLLLRLPEGSRSICALNTPIEEIVAGPFFQSLLPESWALPATAAGKPKTCAKICGKEFDPFQSQFQSV